MSSSWLGYVPSCCTDQFSLPEAWIKQADESSITRISGHLLTACSGGARGFYSDPNVPKSALPLCDSHRDMWNATLEEFKMTPLSELGPMKVPEGGKYGRFAIRPVDSQLPVAAKAGLILLARLSSSEMKRCFAIDELPTETGYQFRARLVGMQDDKGSRVRVYFEGLQRFCDVKSDVVLDDGAWRTLDFTQAYPSLLDFDEGADETGQRYDEVLEGLEGLLDAGSAQGQEFEDDFQGNGAAKEAMSPLTKVWKGYVREPGPRY